MVALEMPAFCLVFTRARTPTQQDNTAHVPPVPFSAVSVHNTRINYPSRICVHVALPFTKVTSLFAGAFDLGCDVLKLREKLVSKPRGRTDWRCW
jgi:hypothetical protein